MGLEVKHGLMVINMRDNTSKEKKMDKVNTIGMMEATIKAIGSITK